MILGLLSDWMGINGIGIPVDSNVREESFRVVKGQGRRWDLVRIYQKLNGL